MPSDVSAALSLLDHANTQFKEVLASLGSEQTASAAAVQSSMVTFLGALEGIQQHLDAFASTTSSRQQQLQKEIRSLEQELQQADQLLLDADMKVNDWQADIQILRTAHEEVLTDSGSSSAQAQAAAATATATAAANGGPDHIDLTEGI